MNNGLLVELLTPRQDSLEMDRDLERFASRYQQITAEGLAVSVPDNPMGALRFQATEVIEELGLSVSPDRLLVHLNTFHTRDGLDNLLASAARMNIRNLLIVSGDGSERLPKLKAETLGIAANTVTSVELLNYVRREHAGAFNCGVAFNPYEPQDHEIEKMKRKVEAGARFIITQPVMGHDDRVSALRNFDLPVFVGAWMSRRVDLLSQCVGYTLPSDAPYDPEANLVKLRGAYPGFGLYLSMVGFKSQFPRLRGILGGGPEAAPAAFLSAA